MHSVCWQIMCCMWCFVCDIIDINIWYEMYQIVSNEKITYQICHLLTPACKGSASENTFQEEDKREPSLHASCSCELTAALGILPPFRKRRWAFRPCGATPAVLHRHAAKAWRRVRFSEMAAALAVFLDRSESDIRPWDRAAARSFPY